MITKKKNKELDSTEAAKILAVARKYIFTYGFTSLTIEDLARQLATNVKKIYAHYRTKPLLIEAAIESKLADLDRDMTAAQEGLSDPTERIHALLGAMKEHTKEFTLAYFNDVLVANSAFNEWLRTRQIQLFSKHFESLLSDGCREEAPFGDVSIEVFTEMCRVATDPAFVLRITKKQAVTDIEGIYKQVNKILLKGVLGGGYKSDSLLV